MRQNSTTRTTMAKAWLPLLAALCLLPSTRAFSTTCEIPLFVQQGLVGANVMLLVDDSLSMNAGIYHDAYDKNVTYTGNFGTTTEYYVTKSKAYTPKSFKSTWPALPSVNLVASDNGKDGIYLGNYLNWVFFHATAAQRAAIPQQTRIQCLKAVLTDLVSRSARLNFGITKFKNDNGGSIEGNCGASYTSILARIAGLTGMSFTPLGEAAEDILDYFAQSGPNAPIVVGCQYNFMIVVTDGEPTMDLDVSAYLRDADNDGKDPGNCTSIGSLYPNSLDCSDYFDDVVYYMAHHDLRPDLAGEQTVSTYVVGYDTNIPLLQEAARNGDGLYFRATNAATLKQSLDFAVQDILRRISAGSAVAVVSTEQGTDDRLYRGKFMPVDWDGYMECYSLPYTVGDAAIWEAGELLQQRTTSSRNIFTALGKTVYDFTDANATTLRASLGMATDAKADSLIDWARGDPVPGRRNRHGWILGPIVHSTPVVVGAPASFLVSASYQAFYQAQQDRRRMVYVGANDGMLHAFDAESGEEAWAFVPQFALPAFAVMADSFYCNKYTVDQTVTVKDVYFDGTWRTVLASGGREGGAAVFALDITDPLSPTVLWQNTLPTGMTFTSDVEIATIGGVPVALVGSGLDKTNKEAWVHSYRLSDGTLLGSKRLSVDAKALRNKASRPISVDRDLDGNVDLVYMADLLGNVYRFDTRATGNAASWTMTTLFSGTAEISANPTVSFGPSGRIYVYFGTGAYLETSDMSTTTSGKFICVIDKHDGATTSIGSLKNQTTIGALGNAPGWYVNLEKLPGERVTETAAVVAETVLFTSYAPDQDACVAGGYSFLYQMAYGDGGTTSEQANANDRVTALGEGVASYPVIDLANGTAVVQKSDASIQVNPIAAVFQRMNVRSWQESFNQVQAVPQAQ